MNLSGILLGTDNPERLIEFYTRLFGEPGWQDGGFSGWQLGSGWLTIGAHDEVSGPNAHPGRVIWNLESADVKADFARLKSAGARVIAEPYNPGQLDEGWIATLADPDDNYFQLMSPMS